MKTIQKIQTIVAETPRTYASVDEFVAAKLKDATESLKKVDLSVLESNSYIKK
ncbi:MAG: hypothetical protein U5M51_01375 [Emticicia sp.]|nr:hypothetical protein [Emticicia sp.]